MLNFSRVRFVVKHRALFGAAPSLTLIHVVPDLLNLVVPGFFGDAPSPGFKPERVPEMQRAAFERVMALDGARISHHARCGQMSNHLALDSGKVGESVGRQVHE